MQSTRPSSLENVTTRFWARVDRSGECWVFLGAKDQDGYGQFMHDRRNYRAHRFALMLHGRPVPDGLVTRHLCGNRACVRYEHLAAGTQAENVGDSIAAGTFHRNPRVLDSAQESALRREYEAGGISLGEVAMKYGVSKSQAHRVVRRAA